LIVTYSSTVSSTEDFYKNKLLIYQILTSTSQFPPSHQQVVLTTIKNPINYIVYGVFYCFDLMISHIMLPLILIIIWRADGFWGRELNKNFLLTYISIDDKVGF